MTVIRVTGLSNPAMYALVRIFHARGVEAASVYEEAQVVVIVPPDNMVRDVTLVLENMGYDYTQEDG